VLAEGTFEVSSVPLPEARLRSLGEVFERDVPDEQALLGALDALGEVLAGPLEKLLPAAQHDAQAPLVVLVPSGFLHAWPLHLLPLPGGRRLWERAATCVVTSATTFVLLAGRGDPDTAGRRNVVVAPDTTGPGSVFLGGAVAEALCALCEQGWEVRLGEQATLEAFLAGYDLAFAGHNNPVSDNGRRVFRLRFADGPVAEEQLLGHLRAGPGYRFGALGACMIHRGSIERGDNLVATSRAFLTRFCALTVSMWSLADDVGAWLGTTVRRLAGEGVGLPEALRRAGLELHEKGRGLLPATFAQAAEDLESRGERSGAAYLRAYALSCLLPCCEPREVGARLAGVDQETFELACRLQNQIWTPTGAVPLPQDARSALLLSSYTHLTHHSLFAELCHQIPNEQHRRVGGGVLRWGSAGERVGLEEIAALVVVGVPALQAGVSLPDPG